MISIIAIFRVLSSDVPRLGASAPGGVTPQRHVSPFLSDVRVCFSIIDSCVPSPAMEKSVGPLFHGKSMSLFDFH